MAINPRNGDVYFTDTLYGYLQDFRPPPALPNMVYRLTPSTGALVAVADGFELPNGQYAENANMAPESFHGLASYSLYFS